MDDLSDLQKNRNMGGKLVANEFCKGKESREFKLDDFSNCKIISVGMCVHLS